IGAFVSTRCGSAVPTDARVAARRRPRSQDGGAVFVAAGSGAATSRAATPAPAVSTWELRTCGLHAERRLSFYPVERLPNQSGEDLAGTGLDEAGRAAAVEGPQDVRPANRARDRG